MYDIVCFGEVLFDVNGSEYLPGGAAFNVAAVSQLLGLRSALISGVGNDWLGHRLRREVDRRNITPVIAITDYKTGVVNVTLDEAGKPRFDIAQNTAYDHIPFMPNISEVCTNAKLFYYGTLVQRASDGSDHCSRGTLKKILSAGHGTTIYDVNLREGILNWQQIVQASLENADIVKMSESEYDVLNKFLAPSLSFEKFAHWLLERYELKYEFVTCGEKGAMVYTRDGVIREPAPVVQVVDTTGCGDAFVASVAHSLIANIEPAEMLRRAVYVAAKVAIVKGAAPQHLERQE